MFKRKKNYAVTVKESLYISFILPAAILIVVLISGIILAITYANTGHIAVLITLVAILVVFAFIYIISMLYSMKALSKVYIDDLYGTTRRVFSDIKNGKISDIRYPENEIKEFGDLNSDLNLISTTFENSTVITYGYDEAKIPLEHIYDDEHFVTLKSFKDNLLNLIFCSQNYRNAILDISYDFEGDKLTTEEDIRLVNVLKDNFGKFKNYLIVPNGNDDGYLVYLPYINSFSKIKEICVSMMKSLSVAKKTYNGLTTIPARFSFVCYPYSKVEELFSDLRYAKRQGQIINFYFPDRLSSLDENEITQNSVNLNQMTKILNSLSGLSVSSKDKTSSINLIRRNMSSIISYLGLEEAGIVSLNSDTNRCELTLHTTNIDNPVFEKEGMAVDRSFIDILNEDKDPDNSYYFSSRFHSNISLTRVFDKYGIDSGFYFVLCEHDIPRAVIFFFNKTKNFVIDSYIRESLFIFSYRVGDYLLLSQKEENFNDTYREINQILMESNNSLYRIDVDTYDLVSFSQHFPVLFPNAKVGEKCYKALYGLDSSCPDCPLKTSKKMIKEIDGNKYSVSLSLNSRNTKLKRMLVHQIKEESEGFDRFDMDLLINSYPSLVLAMNAAYSVHSRGTLLVLRIDNQEKLKKDAGSEGYLFLLRQFINEIKGITKYKAHIYFHDTQSIAILMQESGQIDVVNLCEKIYELSKKDYFFDDYNYDFKVTYLPYSFPLTYPSGEDFLKHVLRHYLDKKYETDKDYIYFADGDYSRSASRNEFMLAVIDEQFGANTFQVVLQPIVRASNGEIYGAELFIRLSDDYRSMVFNTEQLVRVAAQNGKISLISNALLKYIGELYKEYGLNVFNVFGFKRLTINTDFSYFSDPNFFNDIDRLLTSYHFPRGFLGFEITENEVMNNIDKFESIARRVNANHIALICDQYTGESLSIERLKRLGFEEIKIPRNFVSDLEVNNKHLNEVTEIMKIANENDIKITLVGVENSEQYIILRDLDKNCFLQGYHFFRPLDKNNFIDALRDNNNK